MYKVKIPKKNGKFRLVYVPNHTEKIKFRSILGDLEQKSQKFAPEGIVHGFTSGKSPVTNAMQHIGYAFTLSFDLKDFFETVTPDKLAGKLSISEMQLVMVDGAARQGLPTSPAVANIAASDMDKAILKMKEKKNLSFRLSLVMKK